MESRFLWRGLPPGRLNGLDALILNEPYTTVSLAPAMMGVGSVIGRRWSPVFCGAVSPRVGLNGLDALILNDPYTTVSLAPAMIGSAVESRFLWRGLPPGRLNGLDALILNEPYTTVSLAPAMMAASSSSDRSAALRGGPTSSTSIRFGMTLATILR